LLGPVAFTVISTLKVRKLVKVEKTLCFKPSPKRSPWTMWKEIKDLPGTTARLSQLFIYGMEIRFNGGWGKQGEEASFWGFLMGAYTDSFWAIFSWVLFKKLFAALNKHLLHDAHNAIINIVLYSLDLLVFVFMWPFRDNVVSVSQMLAAAANLMAIVIAALPMLMPENWIPEVIRGPLVMWITIAGTTVLTVAAALDPVWTLLGLAVVLGKQVTSCFNLEGPAGTLLANLQATLSVRFEMICLGRVKTKASQKVNAARQQRRTEEVQAKGGAKGRNGTPLTEDEWRQRVRAVTYASKVRKQGVYNPEYKERYMVLKDGILSWYLISEIAVDEFDQYDVGNSKARGSLLCFEMRVKAIESGEDSYYSEQYGKGLGFELTDEKNILRRFMVLQEGTRDVWISKLRKLRKIKKNRPSRRARGPKEDDDDLDLPVPARPFSVYEPGEASVLLNRAFAIADPATLDCFGDRKRGAIGTPPPHMHVDLGFAPAAVVRGRPADCVMDRRYSSADGSNASPHDVNVTASSKPPTFFIEGLRPVQAGGFARRECTSQQENAPSTVARPQEPGASAAAGGAMAVASTVGIVATASLVVGQRKHENDLGGVALNVVGSQEVSSEQDISEISSEYSDSVDLDNENDQIADDVCDDDGGDGGE